MVNAIFYSDYLSEENNLEIIEDIETLASIENDFFNIIIEDSDEENVMFRINVYNFEGTFNIISCKTFNYLFPVFYNNY